MFFPPGVNSVQIAINTTEDGGITISGTDKKLIGLETAELFYIDLTNIQAANADGTLDYPASCIPEFFITDSYPNGRLSSANPLVRLGVVILDTYETGTVTTRTEHTHGEPGTCNMTDVAATIDCDTRHITVTGITDVTDSIVKVWSRDQGELIDVIPAPEGVIMLPYTIDVSAFFDSEDCVTVIFEACGCCVEKTFCCGCEITEINGSMTCVIT